MNYFEIDDCSVVSGEGLRVVLWLSGCEHKCVGCQNPETWDYKHGRVFDKAAEERLFSLLDKDYITGLTLSGGDPLYRENLDNVQYIVNKFNKRYNAPQYIVSDKSDNHNILNSNADEISLSYPDKTIWLYTGYVFENIFKPQVKCDIFTSSEDELVEDAEMCLRRQIISLCDVLVDGRYEEDKRDVTLKWRGSSNQRVIDVQESLKQNKVILYCE